MLAKFTLLWFEPGFNASNFNMIDWKLITRALPIMRTYDCNNLSVK